MKHAALAFVQAVAVVLAPPSVLLHHQVALWPQLLATLDTDVPGVQPNRTLLLQVAAVPQDWLLTPGVAPRLAQVVESHPVCSVQVLVLLPPEQADHPVTVAGAEHAALAFVQAVAVVLAPPSVLLHHQVALWPQLLATLDTDVPGVQPNRTLLLQAAVVPQD